MKKLTKKFIVVYDENNNIITKQSDNTETFVGQGRLSTEFNTEVELEQFIAEHSLIESELIV